MMNVPITETEAARIVKELTRRGWESRDSTDAQEIIRLANVIEACAHKTAEKQGKRLRERTAFRSELNKRLNSMFQE